MQLVLLYAPSDASFTSVFTDFYCMSCKDVAWQGLPKAKSSMHAQVLHA